MTNMFFIEGLSVSHVSVSIAQYSTEGMKIS
jgi:hypothetical protein